MRLVFATTFPDFIRDASKASIMGRAKAAGLIEVEAENLRKYTKDRHQSTDDNPYGGGFGMLMKVEPFSEMLENLNLPEGSRTVLMSPAGKTFNQQIAHDLSKAPAIVFLCGHYEGVDERVAQQCTDWLSLGDFVMTGGEIAALAMADAIIRLIPAVLGHNESSSDESFQNGLLEYPQYTRPASHLTGEVPEVLLKGNHACIESWRREQSLRRTLALRPDLLLGAKLDETDRKILKKIMSEITETLGKIK
jgi:tRNA (guanine37-N1)-methyltransferase